MCIKCDLEDATSEEDWVLVLRLAAEEIAMEAPPGTLMQDLATATDNLQMWFQERGTDD
jgi:hypothetical protein